MEPRDIAELMLEEKSIESESHESAVRTVRGVVAKIRARIDADREGDSDSKIATGEVDALERKLRRLREEHARQSLIASGEPTENCARSGIAVVACENAQCKTTGIHVPFIGPAVGISMMNTPQGPMVSYKALWPAGVRQKASKDAAILAEKIAELEVTLAAKRQTETTGEGAGVEGGLRIIQSGASIEALIKANGVN